MKKKRILILVETSRIYGRQIIEGIAQHSFEKGDWILFLEDRGLYRDFPSKLRKHGFDGIISRTVDIELQKHLTSLDLPMVELLGDGINRSSDVMTDGIRLGRMAAKYYRERHLEHFGFFSIGQNWWSEQFLSAYAAELAENGLTCITAAFSKQNSNAALPVTMQNGLEPKIVDWLRSLPKPIGLFCPSDSQAVYLLNLCQSAELAVPFEILIMGVENNSVLCNATAPPLSSIAVNGYQVGYQASVLLSQLIAGKKTLKKPILIPPIDVVTRASTDSMATSDPDVAKALNFISQQVLSHLKVQDIADSVCLSTRTLVRKFQAALGHSPEKELYRMKMERAKSMLRDSELSIALIAENVGFSSTEYFIKSFRQWTHMTPKQYRQNIRYGMDD